MAINPYRDPNARALKKCWMNISVLISYLSLFMQFIKAGRKLSFRPVWYVIYKYRLITQVLLRQDIRAYRLLSQSRRLVFQGYGFDP